MGQKLATKEIEDGLSLYNKQNYDEAVKKWRRVLHKTRSRKQKFLTLSYLASAHSDWGKYRDMLAYAVMQIDIANEEDDSHMKADAYLNLARSNEKLCEYHKAVSYSRHSLQCQPYDITVHGHVYLSQANAFFGFSNFVKCLENLDRAMRIAKEANDTTLELEIFTSLGNLFTCLKDYEKGLAFYLKAEELAKSFTSSDQRSKYERLSCFCLAVPYRKLGKCNEAMECCEDALKMALEKGDRPVQAKCLCCFADIHRRRNNVQRAYPRYEAAMNIMVETGDRLGQIEVLAGMAKSMILMKQLAKSLEFNIKALDLAKCIGNKMMMLRCHSRMKDLYCSLGDAAMGQQQADRCHQLLKEMELFCGFCDQPIGEKQEKLEALGCCHIMHYKCAKLAFKHPAAEGHSKQRKFCPMCQTSDNTNAVYI